MRIGFLLVVFPLLAAPPALAQVKGAPGIVAVAPPPLSSVPGPSTSGCTPVNPCAVVTPALDSVSLPAPVTAPQPDLPTRAPAQAAPRPAPAARSSSQIPCPPFAGLRAGRGPGAGRAAGAGRALAPGRGAMPPECLPQQGGARENAAPTRGR